MTDILSLLRGLDIDPTSGFQYVDAAVLARQYHPVVNVCQPLLIDNLRDQAQAGEVSATLMQAYPGDHAGRIVDICDDSATSMHAITIAGLPDVAIPNGSVRLVVPALEPGHDFTNLQQTIARLRAPDGCPWDREQTLSSMRQDLLSESVEVMEAIDLDGDGRDNADHIAEELGDVMLIVTMLVQIAVDEGRFRMADVMQQIVSKLIRRHPHVFGNVSVAGSHDVVVNWDAIKEQEKAEKGEVTGTPFDGVPVHLPALEKAREIQSKAAKAGLLDRSVLGESIPQLTELLGEEPDEESIGELLWALTALAKRHGIIAENALRQYAVRYRQQAEEEFNTTLP